MTQSSIISVASNLTRIKHAFAEEMFKKSCESIKHYIDKTLSLEPPYNQEELLMLANMICHIENLLNIQKSGLLGCLILVQSTKNLIEHSIKVQTILKPKKPKEKKIKTNKGLPPPDLDLQRPDMLQYAINENGLPTSYY